MVYPNNIFNNVEKSGEKNIRCVNICVDIFVQYNDRKNSPYTVLPSNDRNGMD